MSHLTRYLAIEPRNCTFWRGTVRDLATTFLPDAYLCREQDIEAVKKLAPAGTEFHPVRWTYYVDCFIDAVRRHGCPGTTYRLVMPDVATTYSWSFHVRLVRDRTGKRSVRINGYSRNYVLGIAQKLDSLEDTISRGLARRSEA